MHVPHPILCSTSLRSAGSRGLGHTISYVDVRLVLVPSRLAVNPKWKDADASHQHQSVQPLWRKEGLVRTVTQSCESRINHLWAPLPVLWSICSYTPFIFTTESPALWSHFWTGGPSNFSRNLPHKFADPSLMNHTAENIPELTNELCN